MNFNPNVRLVPNTIFNDDENQCANYSNYKKITPVKKPLQEQNRNLPQKKQTKLIRANGNYSKPVALDIRYVRDQIPIKEDVIQQNQPQEVQQKNQVLPKEAKRKILLDFSSESGQQNIQSLDAPRSKRQNISDEKQQTETLNQQNYLQQSYQTTRAQNLDLFDQPTYRQQQKYQDVIFDKNASLTKNIRKKFILQIDQQQQDQEQILQEKQQQNNSQSEVEKKIEINPKKQFILANFDESDEEQYQVVRGQTQGADDAFEIIKALNYNVFSKDNPDFMFTPIPKDMVFQCIIRRDKSKGYGQYIYQVYDSTLFKHIVTVKKTQKGCFQFFKKKTDENNSIANLKSNFFGTSFQCFRTPYEQNHQILSVTYETNIFGLKGPRKMKVYIPKEGKDIYSDKNLQSVVGKDPQNIEKFYNKPPKWSSQLGAYVLNFKGRATLPSVKNFLIINDDNASKMFLLFGKAGKQVFNMDIKYPFSIVQAISIAVSSFDKKLACQ